MLPTNITIDSMDDSTKRDFYRKCKEDIDQYLSMVEKEDYNFIYQLVGPPMAQFEEFQGEAAKEVLDVLRLHFANKMKELL